MKLSKICLNNLEGLKNVEGDFAEFGIFEGYSFIPLLKIAKKLKKKMHGFDSFKGMDTPTKEDFNAVGKTSYPKGKFNVGGSSCLISKLYNLGYQKDKDYLLWEGYIPSIFEKVPKNIKFSFCYIDLDQYKPTLYTLNWLWDRLSVKGIILCDDYFNSKMLATKAINKFFESHNNIKIIDKSNWIVYPYFHTQISFEKTGD